MYIIQYSNNNCNDLRGRNLSNNNTRVTKMIFFFNGKKHIMNVRFYNFGKQLEKTRLKLI